MKRLFTPVAAMVLVALVACSDTKTNNAGNTDGGTTASNLTPSISAVIPGKVFQGRTVDVTIAGYATKWDSTTTVDFGADVTVNSITVASPTALVANVTVSATATPGTHDVVVHEGSTAETYKGGFQIAKADGSIPSVNAVNPPSIFLGRTKDVFVSGSNTSWTAQSTVDFGTGIKVNSVTLASPTALRVNITVDASAAAGWRDVSVKTDGETDTFMQSFDVESPVVVTTIGTVAQGSVVAISVKDMDLENPFDTTSTGDGFFTPITYTNFKVADLPGVTFNLSTVTQYSADLTALIDVTATAGKADVQVLSGPADLQLAFPAPGALTIAARTAKALSAGTPVTAMVSAPLATELYTFTPDAMPQIIDLITTASNTSAQPGIILLPKSGAFADVISFSDAAVVASTAADPYYVIYFDNSGTSNYSYLIKATATSATLLSETEPNDTAMTANVVASLPAIVQNAKIESDTAADYFQVTVGSADVGKHFRVITTAGDPKTNTYVDVVSVDPMSGNETSLLDGSNTEDMSYHQDVSTNPVDTAGVYYVKVTPGVAAYDPAHQAYNMMIRLE